MHATFWMRVHPANKAWLEGTRMTGAASRFFRTQSVAAAPTEWTELRRKWETGHLVRAVHAAAGVVALVVALA